MLYIVLIKNETIQSIVKSSEALSNSYPRQAWNHLVGLFRFFTQIFLQTDFLDTDCLRSLFYNYD